MNEEEAESLVSRVVAALEEERKLRGLSQRALAQKAHLDPKTVNLIARGARNPTLYTIALIASAMELPLGAIIKHAELGKPNL